MKKMMIAGLLGILSSTTVCAQSFENKAIKKAIDGFAQAGDDGNADKVADYLDDNYRIVMNQLFGSKEVVVMSRAVYLENIRSGKFGGDDRKVVIENVVINGPNATAKVTYKGEKMTFVNLTTLVKNAAGEWKLVEDVPHLMK